MPELNGIKFEGHYHASGGSFFDNLFSIFKKKKEGTHINKSSVRILFIDDNKFPMIENLKKAGFAVEHIRDIKSDDNSKVIDSQIIFVDYKGVGKNLSQGKEGVGVCQRLKKVYGNKKYIVLSTAESIPNELLQEIRSASDEILVKSSETADFISIIEKGINQLNLYEV